jgi:nicotinate-nucleotide adenylyltransferase
MARLIGVLGGTFDPPHLGHSILAEFGRAALSLDEVLWVLTPISPLKSDREISSLEHRMAMVDLVVTEHEAFSLSRADIDREPPYFAHGTMEVLRNIYPNAELVYLMGSDSLNDLPKWDQPERFIELCDALGVMMRPGADYDAAQLDEEIPGVEEKTRFFDAPFVGISGRDIRQRVRDGQTIRYLVADQVLTYIHRQKLYLQRSE